MLDQETSEMSAAAVNEWLANNYQNMETATINYPACWYDSTDGTCSA